MRGHDDDVRRDCVTLCDISTDGAARTKTRHVSIRLSDELYDRLEMLAASHDETVSQCARRLLDQGSASPERPESAIDDAIAVLQSLRRTVGTAASDVSRPVSAGASPGPADGAASTTHGPRPTPSRSVREVNVHNAKSNLSRLLGDVGRGEEIVIVHAGAPRARLVAVDDDGSV